MLWPFKHISSDYKCVVIRPDHGPPHTSRPKKTWPDPSRPMQWVSTGRNNSRAVVIFDPKPDPTRKNPIQSEKTRPHTSNREAWADLTLGTGWV